MRGFTSFLILPVLALVFLFVYFSFVNPRDSLNSLGGWKSFSEVFQFFDRVDEARCSLSSVSAGHWV
ncbi:MAG: hypothetical protein WAO13_16405, partial [Pseudolabrys sp.]